MSIALPIAGARRGACPSLDAPMQTGDGLLARLRIAGGRLTPAALGKLANIAGSFGNGAVELTARAVGEQGEARRWVTTRDGMEAGGYALAAMAEKVAASADWSGVKMIDDVTDLEPIIDRANELAGSALLELSAPGVVAQPRAA